MKKITNETCVIETVTISNPDKALFENPIVTKKEIALYYQQVSERMLPFLKNRIISTIRCPDGVNNECFYKKHLTITNKGIGAIEIPSEKGNKEDYYYIKSIEGIILEVQMNGIEFHPWGCKYNKLEKPDIMIFDLDPDEGLGLKEIRQGVKDLKSLLDELNLISFLKTSGGKGYHILVPFQPSANWDKFRSFAKSIAEVMEEKWPNRYTSNVRKSNRQGKIFIDWIRNTQGSSCVAPYSIRTKKTATISMPIAWDELNKIAPNEITMDKALKRLKKPNPWESFFDIKHSIK